MASEPSHGSHVGGDECLDIGGDGSHKELGDPSAAFYLLLLRCSDGGPAGGGCAQVLFFGAYQHDGRQYLLCSQGFFRPLP